MKLRGVVVPVAVPLDEAGEPDLEAFRRLIDFLLASGVDGIFVNGSMGAFALLPDRWQVKLIETAVVQVAKRVPVLAGVSDTGSARVGEKIRALQGIELDAFVVMPPYFFLLNQAEMLRFFGRVADDSPLPIVLYDNPRLTKNPLAAATVIELARHENIRGIKASGTDVQQWLELLRAPIDRDRFSLISGAGRMTSLALQLGFDGITEGLHNVIPAFAVALWKAALSKNFAEADRVQQKIDRCFSVFDTDGGWRGLEVAFQYLGISARAAIHPYDLPLSSEKREAILKVLETESVPRL